MRSDHHVRNDIFRRPSLASMTTSRCTATKHATHALKGMDRSVREEIGWEDEFDTFLFNRFMDAFRTVDYLRKGIRLSGYDSMEELHAAELSDVMSLEELDRLPDVDVALALFRVRASAGFES